MSSMFPTLIILGTSKRIDVLKYSLSRLSFSKELDVPEIAAAVFAYLTSVDDAYGNVLEFAEDLKESFADDQSERELQCFVTAVTNYGTAIIQILCDLGVYWEGILWYNFDSFLGDDIIIRKISEEDYNFMC